VKVFWLDKEYVHDQLRQRVAALAGNPNIRKVILFGSFAHGRAVPGSDVDILLILRSDSRDFKERIPEYLDAFSGMGIGVDVFPYTEDETDNPVAKAALATGMVLLER
jgi:predicted nucleotidyltransferase